MAKTTKNTEEVEDKFEEMGLDELCECLASASRRDRQKAAARIAALAKEDPKSLVECKHEIIDALERPEARTRWECLDALTSIIGTDSSVCDAAYESVEEALFDEENGTVRLAAMRFICKMGMVSGKKASKVWPVMDEALQCYHGDPEYTDMLVAVNEFAGRKLPAEVAQGLVDRMEFDANNAKSGLLRRANSIIDAASKSLAKK